MTLESPDVQAALERFKGHYPIEIELSLGRILAVLETLGRPQDRLPPTIHVAGTNGKGSTCAYLRAMAEAAGLKVHVFSSPHLVRFNERIRLAGQLVKDEALAQYLNRTFDALRGRPITHFEATTAAALLAFSEVEADLLILEVGLGGRFDATNVIDTPLISVITPVHYDHKQFLGTDLAKIAWEKAGIIKSERPVVSAIQTRVCADVIADEAQRLKAPLHLLDSSDRDRMPETVALPGRHQRLNAALAAKTLRILPGYDLPEAAFKKGALAAKWPARLQKLSAGPVTDLAPGIEVWLDGGHNPHAGKAIAEVLSDMGGNTVLVSAMMASKDHKSFFQQFELAASKVHTLPNAPGHAGAAPEDLAEKASAVGIEAVAHNCLEDAMRAAAGEMPDRILICGSLYLAGDVLHCNQELPD